MKNQLPATCVYYVEPLNSLLVVICQRKMRMEFNQANSII